MVSTRGEAERNPGDDVHVTGLLSAYIDGALGPEEQATVRRHLDECAGCRDDYAELRATQRLLQRMPTVPPPRAFTLTPEMAGLDRSRTRGFWERLLAASNAPRFAFGSLAAFALLFLLVVGNTLQTSNVNGLTAAQAPAANSAARDTSLAPATGESSEAGGAAGATQPDTSSQALAPFATPAPAVGAAPQSKLGEQSLATPVTGVEPPASSVAQGTPAESDTTLRAAIGETPTAAALMKAPAVEGTQTLPQGAPSGTAAAAPGASGFPLFALGVGGLGVLGIALAAVALVAARRRE